jgi:molybdopterin synthase sulfur carrier subunit
VVRIEFKLFASLMEYLPAGTKGHRVVIEVPDGTTIEEVIDRFKVPRQRAHLVVCNGVFVHPADRDRHLLQQDDVVALWPPIAGG